MNTIETGNIKAVLDRNAKALEMRPSIGRMTASTRVALTDGLACEVEEGAWKLRVDMSPKSGGEGTAPNPGIYGRASLGSCLAIGYAMLAARREIPIDALEVSVETDMDAAYEYGMKGRNRGYEQVRCSVRIESSAPEADVRRMIDDANEASSFLNVWQQAQDLRLDVRVNGIGR
ncbi:MAG: OsmC family protein [Bryobacteraceae bacterium]